ncbi:MAG: amino acid adenylation domain-containing protein, partial [Myxococcales bacterium]|nr:amino acid adenylation domain-containing protein [Myxococcales bacterium]
DAAALAIDAAPACDLAPVARGDSRVYVMYTSGTTGRPKGIEVLHRGIARLVCNPNYMQLDASDRVAQVANPAFDAFTFEMWAALLNGAQLVGVSRETLLDPAALADFIETRELTVMLLTTALFHFVARERPEAFAPLRTLLVGGEALAPRWARRVLERGAPGRLVNAYGPTESTVAATCHVVTEVPEDATSVPIGVPVANTEIHVLDARMRPVPVGREGEIYIGGDGLARGYLGRPELSRERFVPSPFAPGQTLYRTGDLGRWRDDGAIEFSGRVDAQVKIRGFRIELAGVEAAIRRDDAVAEVIVLARDDAAGHKQLVAYIVPEDRRLCAPERRAAARRALASLRARLSAELPECMIPSAGALLEALPLTPNRKLDRARLPEATPMTEDEEARDAAPATESEREIAALWSELLGIPTPSTAANWTACGGNSLLAAQLLLRVHERLGVKVPAYMFYEQPTIAQLAEHVDLLRGGDELDVSDVSMVDLVGESRLDPALRPSDPRPYEWRAPTRVLVTGATGFLGAWVVRDLLRAGVEELHCLVRAADADAGLARVRENMRRYGVWEDGFAARLFAVPGDLTERDLGVPRQDYERLAARVDTIYHSAAHVSYVEPYSWHKPANVVGTTEIIRFAFTGPTKALHHVSTISVFGPNGFFDQVADVYEDTEILSSAALLHLDMGYSQSKWVAEALVFEAQARGLPLNVYRPGFIVGDSATGSCNVDDFIARLIGGCVGLGRFPLLPRQRKEFVAVDFASAALVHISTRAEQLGKRFHLVPPTDARSLSMSEFFELIQACGHELAGVPYAEWVEAVREVVAARPDHVLLPLMPALSERIYDDELTRWELYRDMPRYHSDNTRAALVGSGLEFPRLTQELMARYLEFLRARGLLEAAPAPDAAPDPAARPYVVELANGRRIEVPRGFDPDELRRLIAALEGAA